MKKIFLAFLAAICLFAAVGCEKKVSDDAVSLAKYLQLFEDDPSIVDIKRFDKYEFEGDIDIYDLALSFKDEYGEEIDVELLIKHIKKSPLATLCFWKDINSVQKLHADVKALWDSRNTESKSIYSFSKGEIEKIKQEAIEYIVKSNEKVTS